MDRRLIPVAQLRLDAQNVRLQDEQDSQDAALLALMHGEGDDILNLAGDIVEQEGLSPLDVVGVVPDPSDPASFLVLEGNRRVAALMILESPHRVSPVLTPADRQRLEELHRRFLQSPVDDVFCVILTRQSRNQRGT